MVSGVLEDLKYGQTKTHTLVSLARYLIIFRKILLILIILTSIGITQAHSNIDSECIKLNFENTPLFKKKKLELIDIKINDNRDWQVNNIRILTNNSHVIPEKFKLRFKAEIKVFFTDNTSCTLRAKVRTQGDLKDHIFYKNGKVFQSLDVSLNDGHINNIQSLNFF